MYNRVQRCILPVCLSQSFLLAASLRDLIGVSSLVWPIGTVVWIYRDSIPYVTWVVYSISIDRLRQHQEANRLCDLLPCLSTPQSRRDMASTWLLHRHGLTNRRKSTSYHVMCDDCELTTVTPWHGYAIEWVAFSCLVRMIQSNLPAKCDLFVKVWFDHAPKP